MEISRSNLNMNQPINKLCIQIEDVGISVSKHT